jgi:hypothetical protein
MKKKSLLLIAIVCVATAATAVAAEKNKTLIQLEATRSAVGTASGKIEGNKEAAEDLERARKALMNADESFKTGKSFFGDISPETEKEIKLSVDTADIATATALSRVELVRAAAEMEAIEKQVVSVKAKLKLFEDRKAELERLRLEVAVCQKTTKELETVKLEKSVLAAQADLLVVERNRADKLKIEQLELTRKLDGLTAENTHLTGQLEKLQAEMKVITAAAAAVVVPPPQEETKKKPAKK